jgi:hypothetical protein
VQKKGLLNRTAPREESPPSKSAKQAQAKRAKQAKGEASLPSFPRFFLAFSSLFPRFFPAFSPPFPASLKRRGARPAFSCAEAARPKVSGGSLSCRKKNLLYLLHLSVFCINFASDLKLY